LSSCPPAGSIFFATFWEENLYIFASCNNEFEVICVNEVIKAEEQFWWAIWQWGGSQV
jgi:hypothetical protein